MLDASTGSLRGYLGEEVRAYRIHVSSKYLDLTKKKLELTRLPHEILLPPAREWENGTPKGEIEPLIDYWLETYSWRTVESHLNATLPQFRTAIQIGEAGPPLRIHFLHIRSQHANAIPLLLIPSFPLTNLSLRPTLWKPLLDPNSRDPAFHIVVPSIPGLGFSDAFTAPSEQGRMLAGTARIFDTLMQRLGYEFYLVSTTGSGVNSPSHIDYHIGRLLGEEYGESCLGVHLIEPPLRRPTFAAQPWGWVKLGIARFFHAPIFGYTAEDFKALKECEMVTRKAKGRWRSEENVPVLTRGKGTGYGAVGMLGLREPNTLAYALCDSPVGLLSLVMSALRKVSPGHKLEKDEIVNLAELAWLPGPEAALKFWAGAVSEVEEIEAESGIGKRARVALTVFGVDCAVGEEVESYVCPAWGQARHDIVFSQRVSGRPGLVAWERGDVVVEGVRGLATAVTKLDARLRIEELDQVVVDDAAEAILKDAETVPELDEDHGMQLDVESPDTVVALKLS